MTLPTATTSAGGIAGGSQELPFPPALIEELLRLVVKAVRAHQLYLPNNQVYKGAIEAVRAAFAPIWQHADEFALTFTETDIRWLGHPVMVETAKSADSLPWTFVKDGVREIQLSRGFEEQELVTLFEILQRVRKAAPEEDDLLTMLWEADFSNLRYRYVDLGAEPVAPLDGVPPESQPASSDQVRTAAREQPAQSHAGVVNMQDFDATLYFLDESELDYLRRDIDREYAGDLRQDVVAILLDIYETQPAPAARDEVAEGIETMLLLMLASGELRGVAYLLAESQVAVSRGANVTPEQRDRLGLLPDRLSAAEPLGQLLQTLDESANLPPQAELTALIGQLRPAALATIFSWLQRLRNPNVRGLVEAAAERLAATDTAEFVKLVQSKEAAVAVEAIRRSGAMKATAAVAPLARVLAEDDIALRQAAVQALAAIGTPGALQALERSIDDADREVRVAAVRALGAKAYRGAFARLEQAVKGGKLRDADLTEKMAFFEAYGAMCGDGGIVFLDGLLNGKSMFGKREDAELRACAAMALGRVGSKRAQEVLQRSAGEKDIVVRNAVGRALRGGAE